MVFSSSVFLLFFLPAVMILYYLPGIRNFHYKNFILLFFSIAFYVWGEPTFLFWIAISIFVDWLCGLQMERTVSLRRKKIWLAFALTLHLTLLFFFKYISFLSEQLSGIAHTPTLNIALPIGISFFSFQMMSYVVDVYRGKVPCQKNIFKLTLYIMFFPQLIAGPIVRYEDVAQQMDQRTVSLDDFYTGISRFIIGLSKKVLLADILATVADNLFLSAPYVSLPAVSAWIGAIAFSFQIYFDFSGYSDMAIGLARCFGFHFLENFSHPYIATSITEFWRRWHISLTGWFRDYVYIPLGGNRVKKSRWIFNLACVWLLTGIWHGANWTFLLWGLIYFLFQLIEKLHVIPISMPTPLRWIATMVIVCCCWVIFKADSIGLAFSYLAAMFGKSGVLYDGNTLYYLQQCARLFIVSGICCLPLGQYSQQFLKHYSSPVLVRSASIVKTLGLLSLLCLCLLTVISGAYSPFIYFNF